MEKLVIKSLKKGDSVEGLLIVKVIEDKLTKNGKNFYRLLLSDGDTEMEGFIWSENYHLIKDYPSYKGRLVKIKAKVDEYQGKINCSIDGMKIVEDEALKRTFIKYSSSSDNYESYKSELVGIIDKINDPEIKKLCQFVFLGKYRTQFLTYPAAKANHHNGYGGLLEHSVNLAKLALCCADNYTYDFEFDKDLLIAGALFQDLGKIYEFDIDDTYNVTYSKVGALKGHITIGNEMLYGALNELGFDSEQDKFCRLSHIILSHHGLQEFGSPTFPSTPEAILIARLDKLDADIKSSVSAVKSLLDGQELTNRLFNLENVQVLGPKAAIYLKKEEIIEEQADGEVIIGDPTNLFN